MLRLRRCLMWLVLLAVPLQAYSAVSMQIDGASMSTPAAHGHESTDAPSLNSTADDESQMADMRCGLCALSCCHALALPDSACAGTGPIAQQASLSPSRHLHTRSEAPPKKPPRL